MVKKKIDITGGDTFEEMLESFKDIASNSTKDPEIAAHKKEFAEKAVAAAKLYPMSFFCGTYGVKVTPDEQDGVECNSKDYGVKAILFDRDWLDARVAEYCLAGKPAHEAKKLAGQSAFISFSRAINEIIEDLCVAGQDWGVEEKHAVEVLAALLLMAISTARDNGIPASVLKGWCIPILVACLDDSDVMELDSRMTPQGAKELKRFLKNFREGEE